MHRKTFISKDDDDMPFCHECFVRSSLLSRAQGTKEIDLTSLSCICFYEEEKGRFLSGLSSIMSKCLTLTKKRQTKAIIDDKINLDRFKQELARVTFSITYYLPLNLLSPT